MFCSSTILGAAAKTAHKESYQRMLWVQEIPSYRLLKPTSWKFANRQEGGISPFRSSWPGLCRTDRVYKLKTKKEGKAYSLLFACSLTRAVHLELLPNQTDEEFTKHLRRFIARRGRPRENLCCRSEVVE